MANFNIFRYLNIKVQQVNLVLDNYTAYIIKEYNVRECEANDFGDDQKSIDLFNNINNSYYLNICPDIQLTDNIYLSGDYSYNIGNLSYFQFNVTRCDN